MSSRKGYGAAIGDRIRDLRVRRGWNQRDLAGLVGMNFSDLSRLEKGELLTIPRLLRLSEVFGVSLEVLVHPAEQQSERLARKLRLVLRTGDEAREALADLLEFVLGLLELPKEAREAAFGAMGLIAGTTEIRRRGARRAR